MGEERAHCQGLFCLGGQNLHHIAPFLPGIEPQGAFGAVIGGIGHAGAQGSKLANGKLTLIPAQTGNTMVWNAGFKFNGQKLLSLGIQPQGGVGVVLPGAANPDAVVSVYGQQIIVA